MKTCLNFKNCNFRWKVIRLVFQDLFLGSKGQLFVYNVSDVSQIPKTQLSKN